VAATASARDHIRAELEREGTPSPDSLPTRIVDDELRMEFAGERVHAFRVPPAHTDGDLIVHFPDANVIHLGDLFVNGAFPYISKESGGRIDGVIAAQRRVLELCDAETRIVPGHGPVGGRAELTAALHMLETARGRVAGLRRAGRSLEETQEMDPLADLEAAWGGAWIDSRKMAGFVYATLPDGGS
jgi:glyoxylase-like metal-dependent hydrolase (beta-lactamase superfamily II)